MARALHLLLWAVLLWAAASRASAAPNEVAVHTDDRGSTLRVDGADTLLFGMNWDYIPIGQNYSYDLWSQPDARIEAALRPEMELLADMGVNAIRLYPGIPPRWVEWIHDRYGIYTMINPLVGRYGTTVGGRYLAVTPYDDPVVRTELIRQTLEVVDTYRDTRGVILFLLGNEANYGLTWSSFEIQALPKDEQPSAKARALYSLYGEIVDRIHAADPRHPVAICNGDLQYLDLVAELVPHLDVLAANVYRGASAGDLFQRVHDTLGVPFLFSEFGSDAYDAVEGEEDAAMQARYLHDQWREIYEQSAGKGRVGNAIGGFVFQWSDGWWKFGQESNLDVHDTNASWPDQAYPDDYVDGRNNMNEEWFGITAKEPPGPDGTYVVVPRTAYWMMRDLFRLDPYAEDTDLAKIATWFDSIVPSDYTPRYEAAAAAAAIRDTRARIDDARLDLSTFTTGGTDRVGRGALHTSFDHLESAYLGAEVRPVDALRASASVNVLGNVPDNRIDTIFFENRGNRSGAGLVVDGVDLSGAERVKLYDADFSWQTSAFDLDGYYRVGHYHWGYEGDFFGLYREANYGPMPDVYDADVPIGVTFSGKRGLDGLKVAFGPQIYWGANPTVIAKYRRTVGAVAVTVMHQEDIAPLPTGQVVTSGAIAEQMTRRSTLHLGYARGDELTVDVGGIWGGSNKVGQPFVRVQPAEGPQSYGGSGYDVIDDAVRWTDTLGAKAKVSTRRGPMGWYAQGAVKGLVADGGPDAVTTLTGWSLKESGRGNQVSALTGGLLQLGSFQIAPNFLYQKPLVGPNPLIADSYDPVPRVYLPVVRPRNVVDDPFAVLDNRETQAGELLLVYDPTPGSWFFAWDSDDREDARFAAALDLVYRHQPTARDANFGFTADGVLFAFDGSPPAHDVWSATARLVFGLPLDGELVVLAWTGQDQSTGTDPRLVFRKGARARLWLRSILWDAMVKVDDWGPFDYYRDFNLTYPLQLSSDVSGGLGRPRLVGPSTRFGGSFVLRYLDEHSPEPVLGPWHDEFEVRTYVRVSL